MGESALRRLATAEVPALLSACVSSRRILEAAASRQSTRCAVTRTLDGVVLLEFPDLAGAKAWYESEAYQEAKKLRDGAADTELFIVDGGMAPPDERLAHLKERQPSMPAALAETGSTS